MGEYQATTFSSILEREENLITAVENIVKALDTCKNLTNDARIILVDLGSKLINIARTSENTEDESPTDIQINLLNAAQDKDMKWRVSQSVREDYGPKETNGYLKAVYDAPRLTGRWEKSDVPNDSGEDVFLQRAHDTAKSKLEEFRNLLVRNRQHLKPKDTSSNDDSMNDGPIFLYRNLEEDGLLQKASDTLPNIITDKMDDASIVSFEDGEEDELLQRACDILRTAVQRARNTVDDDSIVSSGDSEDWCMHIYDFIQTEQSDVQSRHFESEHVAINSNEDSISAGSIIYMADDLDEDFVKRDRIIRDSNSDIFKSVNPDLLPDLKSIANLLFNLDYGPECSQTYISVRNDALNGCLLVLEVEKLCMDDVLKREWKTLTVKCRKWIKAMNIFVRIYLAGEKWLSDQIFGELESVSSMCFAASSSASILQLLNFAEAIAIGPLTPERLFKILDVYEVISDLTPDIDAMYTGDTASHVRMEWQEILRRLGNSAKKSLLEFENRIGTDRSFDPFPSGAVHSVTRYVMNYCNTLLSDYRETLDVILEDHETEHLAVSGSPDCSSGSNVEHSLASPVALYFRYVLALLEGNLDDKSKLYKDDAQRHLFLMNNVFYMTQKVKNSTDLKEILLDGWIIKHQQKFLHHAFSYQQATWSSILALLKDDRLQEPGTALTSRTPLRQRMKKFYTALEAVYKSQTGWLVPDRQLREDLKISASLNVVQALRAFITRNYPQIDDKLIKYSPEQVESFLQDLFEGSPRSLHNFPKKG